MPNVIKHVIIWTFNDGYSNEEKARIKTNFKTDFDKLIGIIPGMLDASVEIDGLDSSTGDMMLICTFDSIEALKAYAVNPQHLEVANSDVKPYVKVRDCFDYETTIK